MAFNPALGRNEISGSVDGFVNQDGKVWDEERGLWRNPDGSVAEIRKQDDPPSGSKANPIGQAATLAGGAIAAGAGKKAGEFLINQFRPPPAPTLISATRVPGAVTNVAGATSTAALPSAQQAISLPVRPPTPELISASRVPGTQAAGGSLLSNALDVVGGVGGAIGAADLLSNSQRGNPFGAGLQGAASGAGLGNIIPGVGTVLGAIGGGVLGLAKSFEGGKSDEQTARDAVRSHFEELGVAFRPEGSGSHHIELADGTLFDIGRDGQTGFTSFDGSQEIKAGFEVDITNPGVEAAIGAINPLFAVTTGLTGDEKGANSIAMLVNGVMSNANGDAGVIRQNAKKLFDEAGVTQEGAFRRTIDLLEQGKIDEQTARAFQNGINNVFGQEFRFSPQDEPVRSPQQEIAEELLQGGF